MKQSSAFLFQLSAVNNVLFTAFGVMFFIILCFLLVISLLKNVPKDSSEELLSFPKCKKAVMYLTKKIHGLGKLHSG